MKRIENHPGLRSGELAYATGDETWPTARVRVTPRDEQAEREDEPNAAPMPLRIVARFSASLIDKAGDVERIAGRLLLGPESVHSWQFDAGAAFDPTAWIDDCAARVIEDLLKQARGISAAAAAGLIAPEPERKAEIEPEPPPFFFNTTTLLSPPQGDD